MDSKHRPTPLPVPVGPQRKRCPVCHETVYSRAGIHPQCAVKQSEPPHVRVKEEAAEAEAPLAAAAAAAAGPGDAPRRRPE